MSEQLVSLLPNAARAAVVGGPEVIDDIELVTGIAHGVNQSRLSFANG